MIYHRLVAFRAVALLFLLISFSYLVLAADSVEIRGTVTFKNNGRPIHGAEVVLMQLGRAAIADDAGNFSFPDVPPGIYDISAHMHAFAREVRKITVPADATAGEVVIVNLQLALSPMRQEIAVTASAHAVTAFDAFQSVSTLDSLQLGEQSSFGLGDLLGDEPGIHKRSFGPGSSRPVIRGFDGNRVLVLNDSLASGTLSAQSGEHAEPVDAANMDRIEIVKGPATLLYGSNAIGGVVNMVSGHHQLHESPHPGMRGQLTTIGGTNNHQAAAHANVEYGSGKWLVWSSGARQVASDYRSPEGRVDNSATRMTSGSLGFGWFDQRPFFNFSYSFDKGRLGVPFAGEFHHHDEDDDNDDHDGHDHEHDGDDDHDHDEEAVRIDETFTRQDVRLNIGVRGLDFFFDEFRLATNFSRWMHTEFENDAAATSFDNKLFNLRATFSQRRSDTFNGTTGVHFLHRDYSAQGEEALSPPVIANGIAFFTLQEIDLKAARIQLGGRLDHTSYDPTGMATRAFTEFSGAAGVHLPLGKNTAFVANYTHSNRVPDVEELYNHGPHIGNLVYEIGDPSLTRETADGIDFSLRYQNSRARAEANFYYYGIRDFIYLNLTGGMEHGLREAAYSQADARFIGGEALVSVELFSNLWLNTVLDKVSAERTATGTPLPRIPPLRASVGFDARWRGFSLQPKIIMAAAQDNIYPTETRTPGYTTVDLDASWTLARTHSMHVFSASVFNVGDRLYRNHLSFIKDLAPEMGRGARFSYSLRFF